jgi:hypothetical protein
MRTSKEKNDQKGLRRRKVDLPSRENYYELRNDLEFSSDPLKGDSSSIYRSRVPANEEISFVKKYQSPNPHTAISHNTEIIARSFSKEKLLSQADESRRNADNCT